MTDPQDASIALMAKWVVLDLEPGGSNFRNLLRFKLMRFQPHFRGAWDPFIEWCISSEHHASSSSPL
jgi:hypothetical protein